MERLNRSLWIRVTWKVRETMNCNGRGSPESCAESTTSKNSPWHWAVSSSKWESPTPHQCENDCGDSSPWFHPLWNTHHIYSLDLARQKCIIFHNRNTILEETTMRPVKSREILTFVSSPKCIIISWRSCETTSKLAKVCTPQRWLRGEMSVQRLIKCKEDKSFDFLQQFLRISILNIRSYHFSAHPHISKQHFYAELSILSYTVLGNTVLYLSHHTRIMTKFRDPGIWFLLFSIFGIFFKNIHQNELNRTQPLLLVWVKIAS